MDIGGGTSLGLEGEEGTDIGAAAAAVWLRTGHELGFGETERGVVVGAVGDAELMRERQILAGGAGEGEFAGGEVVGEAGDSGETPTMAAARRAALNCTPSMVITSSIADGRKA